MNKKLTAWLLSIAIVCTVLPTASAASQIKSILMKESNQINTSSKVIEPQILSQKEHEEFVKSSEPEEEIIVSCNYSAQENEFSSNYGEYLTNNFSTYGEQLSNLIYPAGETLVRVGNALQRMYNNMKADLQKGTNGAIFRGDTDTIMNLGVTINLQGIDEKYYKSLAYDMCWIVYRCLDSDFPDMFYSNGYCKVAYDRNGSYVTLYSLPQYRAGFTTLNERISLYNQLETRVKQLVSESSNYPTAYDKIKFFHDWLCANNSYNHEAAESSTTYAANVSGAPWSAVGALLSNTNSSIPGPVCEAYSRAFQLLCKRIGMTATVVVSESGVHMWNNIRYGQMWTGVDVTWDDDSGTYNYFCQKVNGLSGHRMDDSDFSTWLSYPELSAISGSGELPFYDVGKDYWARSFIQNAYDRRYITGISCVDFGINVYVTRAQFATILYSMADKPDTPYMNQFTDVPEGKWYTEAVLWAYQQGITAGYPNGRFGIDDKITREQMITILYKRDLLAREGFISVDIPVDPETPIEPEPPVIDDTIIQKFTDVDQIDSWAYIPMLWAVENNIIAGYQDNTLKPLGNAIRSECAAMISKIA